MWQPNKQAKHQIKDILYDKEKYIVMKKNKHKKKQQIPKITKQVRKIKLYNTKSPNNEVTDNILWSL